VDGVDLTFWNYCEADATHPIRTQELGQALRMLPSFTMQLDEADELLRCPAAVPQLPGEDRFFLRTLHRTVVEAIDAKAFENRPLHGGVRSTSDDHPAGKDRRGREKRREEAGAPKRA